MGMSSELEKTPAPAAGSAKALSQNKGAAGKKDEEALLDQLAITTIRTLAMDAVQAAHSGHPGTPMALAPVAYILFKDFLRYDPDHPHWENRDRFVLSAGHASMLLYSLLYLTGVRAVNEAGEVQGAPAVSLEDIKNFRQLDSKTPGHPEYGHTTGVEATTGPLGQGLAMSVGMTIAQSRLAACYNKPDYRLFDYDVYAIASDGDMMEGMSHEAASLAGHLRLAHLCWVYDNNHITIDGSTSLSYSDDIATRFAAYGWHVAHVSDANDLAMLRKAFGTFKDTYDRPTLIIVNSHIGYGAPHKQDTAKAHGSPLGEEEVRLTKRFYGWPEDAHFLVPEGVKAHFAASFASRGLELHAAWEKLYARYKSAQPDLAAELAHMQRQTLPDGWDLDLPRFKADPKGLATRDASGQVLNAIARHIPWLVGGAADLAESTKTTILLDDAGDFEAHNYRGRNLNFGIRELAMAAVCNGMALSKFRAYGSSFLVFSDYARPAIRLSAIMKLPVIYIFSHDSIGLGEDGPTHQPIEHLASLRAIPGLITLRPADAHEVVAAWRVIMALRDQPVILVLTRQNVPTIDREKYAPASGVAKGAYILADAPQGKPDVLLIGTGSEVSLCLASYEQLAKEGIHARVVSMPSWELFEKQDKKYRDQVLPPAVKARVAIEQAASFGWERYVGTEGAVIGMHSFGASAPFAALQKKFGFTTEHLIEAARAQVGRQVEQSTRRT